VALGGIQQRRREIVDLRADVAARRPREQRHIGRHLIVARPRGVAAGPPAAPASSVTRRSTAVWMSSSDSVNANVSSSSSEATTSSARSNASPSSALTIPCAANIRTCARDCATSCGHSRRSNASDAFRRRNTGSWGSEKRDTGR